MLPNRFLLAGGSEAECSHLMELVSPQVGINGGVPLGGVAVVTGVSSVFLLAVAPADNVNFSLCGFQRQKNV